MRRGLAFRSPHGETAGQIATMATLFALAVAALLVGPSRPCVILLMAGFAGVALFDARAARREEAPPFFAKLRPVQMLVPLLSLGALLPLS